MVRAIKTRQISRERVFCEASAVWPLFLTFQPGLYKMWNPAIPDWRTRFENIKPCVEPCTECDISVSKLLSLETYVNFLKVSFSVSGKIVSKKSYHFGETWSRKKSLGFSFGQHFGLVTQWSCNVSASPHYGLYS